LFWGQSAAALRTPKPSHTVTFYLAGELVGLPQLHPLRGGAVRLPGWPENLEAMTLRLGCKSKPAGQPRLQMPKSYDEMVVRRKALQARAALSAAFSAARPITSPHPSRAGDGHRLRAIIDKTQLGFDGCET
jgi:hypothetical protein